MSAYMVERDPRCRCGRRATHEVFNARNGSLGMFCRACGVKRVKALKSEEDRP